MVFDGVCVLVGVGVFEGVPVCEMVLEGVCVIV
jgi:hypothetical protein